MKYNQGRSFVTIMVFIALCALILRVIIEKLINFNVAQNESHASVTIKFVSAALENYAKDHLGIYPRSLSFLTEANPAYLEKEYIEDFSRPVSKGYNYICSELDESGYLCSAAPAKCGLSGNTLYSVSTEGVLKIEKCEKKERE